MHLLVDVSTGRTGRSHDSQVPRSLECASVRGGEFYDSHVPAAVELNVSLLTENARSVLRWQTNRGISVQRQTAFQP